MTIPTEALAIAVIDQTVRDLDIKPVTAQDAKAVYESRLFWLSDSPSTWAQSRRHWLESAGFGVDKATRAIRAKLAKEGITVDNAIPPVDMIRPEPNYVYTVGERRLLKMLPHGELFVADGDVEQALMTRHRSRDSLIEKGALESFGESMFRVPEDVDPMAKHPKVSRQVPLDAVA